MNIRGLETRCSRGILFTESWSAYYLFFMQAIVTFIDPYLNQCAATWGRTSPAYESMGLSPCPLSITELEIHHIIVYCGRVDTNRETTGRMARKDVKFHLFHECMHRTVRPTSHNSRIRRHFVCERETLVSVKTKF